MCAWTDDPLSCTKTWYRCEDHIPTNLEFENALKAYNTEAALAGRPLRVVASSNLSCGVTGCYDCNTAGTCGNNPAPIQPPAADNNNAPNAFSNPLPTPPTTTVGNYYQTKCGSVGTLNGTISNIGLPSNQYFSKDCDGSGTPGIPMSNGASSFGSGTVSSTGWVAGDALNSQGVISDKISYRNDVDYMRDRILANIRPTLISGTVNFLSQLTSGTPYEDGVYYVRTEGDVDIYADLSNIGDTRIVLLSGRDINIYQPIKFNGGTGLFAAIATRDINIDPIVGATAVDPDTREADLMGVYMAQQNVNTGSSIRQLRVDGVVVGVNKVNLQRTLVSAFPAEYFVFSPEIVLSLPKALLRQNHFGRVNPYKEFINLCGCVC